MLKLLAILLICHFIADFPLQSREMGKQKSEKLGVLLKHVSVHFLVFAVVLPFFVPLKVALLLSLFNAMLHALIDWNIWNLYKLSVKLRNPGISIRKLSAEWKYYDDHWFYTTIGLDQLLHGLSILLAIFMVNLVLYESHIFANCILINDVSVCISSPSKVMSRMQDRDYQRR